MLVSYIINTAAGDQLAAHNRGNKYRSTAYSGRAKLLEEKVLPAAWDQGFQYRSNGEIIVAGVWRSGNNYEYVRVDPVFRDRRDALYQREIGARYSTGDILVFGHDDHMLGPGFLTALRDFFYRDDWDILVPKRVHGITGAELNNGRKDGYMGGHVFVIKRWLWARVPHTSVDTEWWDHTLSRLWREEGGKIVWTDVLTHVDVEALEGET